MRARWAAAGTGLLLGLLAVGPGLGPGFVLSYDMVFVPDPAFTRATFGLTGSLPRAVPSDAVVTAFSYVLPASIVQKGILLAIFVMACMSAADLVPSARVLPRLAAGVVYAWNPFVAERLLLGQWALLLGYAALPWVVLAALRLASGGHGARRLFVALIPAAVGGFAAMAVSGLTVLVIALAGRSRWRAVPLSFLVVAVLSLPWLIPAFVRSAGIPANTAAVGAFAARADTPFGTLGSLLLLGGGWNAETVPPGYGAVITSLIWLLVILFAFVGYLRWGVPHLGLSAAAISGFVVAVAGAVVPGVPRSMIGLWAGFGVFRDGQQFVAPLAVVVAFGFGVAVARIGDGRAVGFPDFPLGLAGVLLPVALLPGLAWGAGGRLHAVSYPAVWGRAARIIDADGSGGSVLVLPWAAYRSYPWNGGRRVLDPLPRFLHRRVIVNDAVSVVGAGEIAAEDPLARRLDPLIRSGAPLAAPLRAAGVRFVAVDADGAFGARLAGAQLLIGTPDLILYRLGPA